MTTVPTTNGDGWHCKWFTSMNSATMMCRRDKRNFFLLLHDFYYYYSLLLFLLPELLQGLLTTWLQAQKHIGMHSPNVDLKTHVQRKQMYVGLHHMVQILYYNQTLCVCVCVCACS
jgi:hypothetical protein